MLRVGPRYLTCARTWRTVTAVGSRPLTLSQPSSQAFHTMLMGNTARQKVGTMNLLYSHSTAGIAIAAVKPQPDTKMLQVQWIGGGEDMYPYLWLRDNCQCTKCFHPVSLSRQVMLKDLNLSLKCRDVKLSNDGEQVEVYWKDGHHGTYDAQWLHERAFRKPDHELRHQQCRIQKKYWGVELQNSIPHASFTEVLRSDEALLAFLENLEIWGVVLVSGVPTEAGQIKVLSKRIGRLKETHYGTTFDVVNKIDPNNLAYTGLSLDMHSDLPFLEDKPGIQLLHCIKQFTGKGGDTLLRDGFAAALELRMMNPKYYEALTQTMVDFLDVGVEGGKKFHASMRAPIIEIDTEGTIRNINWNQMVRDSHFRVSSETASLWYAAALAFRDILIDSNGLVTQKLQPGNLLVFDNLRVLHGRLGYSAHEGERVLQGCYWEWDVIRSLRQVLHKEMTA